MIDLEKKLQEGIHPQNIKKDEYMSNHTSFKIGGKADYFIKVETIEELKFVLKIANAFHIPFFIIGNGTNLLVRDKGIRGFVIQINFKNISIQKKAEAVFMIVGAGMTLATLSSIAVKEALTGLEFLAGIPGTVGGAVRMNAGAYGGEIKDVIVATKYMTYDGIIKTINLEEHNFSYRNSVFSKINGIILETTFRTNQGDRAEIEKKIKEYAEIRKKKQPLEFPNAGSIFKRKENVITAKLIDDCKLKGYRIGDAEVSTKHAGFIVNKGKATAEDVLTLIEHVKKEVKEQCNEEISLEILVVGEK